MMDYSYSAQNNAFYSVELKSNYESAGTWPDDAVFISEQVFSEFSSQPPVGKIRGSNADGKPCWLDIPLPSQDELRAIAESEKQGLIEVANVAITPLAYAVDLDIATANEKRLYDEWRKYHVLLNRVDTTQAPNIVWPVSPAT